MGKIFTGDEKYLAGPLHIAAAKAAGPGKLERLLPKRGNLSKALSVDASEAITRIKLKKTKSVDDRGGPVSRAQAARYMYAISTKYNPHI